MTQRIAVAIEYLGHEFHGWQRQRHSYSAQEALEDALSRVGNEPITTIAAGRTDAGVHGLGQVVHFDTHAQRSNHGWLMGVNVNTPFAMSLRWAKPVDDQFHARFSAIARRYRYVILNRLAPSALFAKRVTPYRRRLDADLMQQAAQSILGSADFSAFRAVGCQAHNPHRDLQVLNVQRRGDWVFVDVQANAFLYNMVRILVGSLVKIGAGDWPVTALAEILESKDRRRAGPTMVADGLYFLGPIYPASFGLPEPQSDIEGVF